LAGLIDGLVAAEQKGGRWPIRSGTVGQPGSSSARVDGLDVNLPINVLEADPDLADTLRVKVWPLLESGQIRPILHATFPLQEAHAAHALMESGQHIGKIVLTAESGTC
jgi:NADPH:quinone reductase-like Zn-dependent oxidoreductase